MAEDEDVAPEDPWKAADESWRAWQAMTAAEDGTMHDPVAADPRAVHGPAAGGPRSMAGGTRTLRDPAADGPRSVTGGTRTLRDPAADGPRSVAGGTRTLHDPAAGGPRSVTGGAVVELREVTKVDVRAMCRLAVAPGQMSFVAPNAVSFAEALFDPRAWYRGIYADGMPVGFAMLAIDRDAPRYYLWRFMIDARYQGRGYGRAAIGLIVDFVRTLPQAVELLVSWVPADGGPEPFYRGLSFVPTGEMDGIEVEARLAL